MIHATAGDGASRSGTDLVVWQSKVGRGKAESGGDFLAWLGVGFEARSGTARDGMVGQGLAGISRTG